jgi:L-fucose isomerase-like protein
MTLTKVKIGFLPSNWEDWDGTEYSGKWAGKMRDRCVAVMERIPGLELVVPSHELTRDGCVNDIPEARKALKLFLDEGIQGLIIGNMTFGMEVAVGTLLEGIRRDMPILHFTTRSGPIHESGARSTDTWCGALMTVSAIKRRGFTYTHIRTCNPEEPQFAEGVETFVRACCAIQNFKGLHVGQLGTRPALFESQIWNEQLLQKNFNQMVVPMDLATVFMRFDEVSRDDPEVLKIAREITRGVVVLENAETSVVDQARFEVALKRIAKELDVSALASSCWTQLQKRYGISACSTFSRLNQQGLITACEVDLMGALTMYAMRYASLGQAIPDFIDWTDLHPTEPDTFLAWHCGNAASSLCAEGCQATLTRNLRMIQWCENCHGALEFEMKAGPVTCGRLVEYDGRFTFFHGTGEIVHMNPYIRGAYGWVKVNDVGDWEDKMVEHGVIHHGVLIHDPRVSDALELFCKYLGIQSVRGK